MVARDITLPVDPDEAWDALTDPELLEQWFGDGDREAVIEEAEPGERLVFWWWEEGEPGSRVELRLVAVPAGTRVSVREAPVGPFAARVTQPDVFAALADPTRRTVMREVSTRGSATATELALPLGVTRQAVAKHLAVLADAGLVDARREGRETRYRPTPAPLGEAISWMTSVGGAWDERLAALERQVARRRERG